MPIQNSQDYFCYKQFYTLNIQAACDYRSYLMDAENMWPANLHYAKFFANSSLNQILQNNLIRNTLHFHRQNVNEMIKNYITGGPAYLLLPLTNMSLVQMTHVCMISDICMFRAA